MNETIHVAYAFDDNYTEMSVVSMVSLLENTDHNIHIHVLEGRLSDCNKEVVASLCEHYDNLKLSFHCIEIDLSWMSSDNHLTPETYFRLYLPEVLPYETTIIWIDSDTIIDGDIAELWDLDLQGNTVGLAIDVGNDLLDFHVKRDILGIDKNSPYFNCGVMLIDLRLFKECDLLNKSKIQANRLYQRIRDKKALWYADQDLINYFLKGKIYPLPPKFNFQQGCYGLYRSPLADTVENYSLETWREAFARPLISHYIDVIKPERLTRQAQRSINWRKYYDYKALSPFADVDKDNASLQRYNELESATKKGLIEQYSYINDHWYELFADASDLVKRLLGQRKLALWGAGKHTKCFMAIAATKGLYADVIVDGVPTNQNTLMFGYDVQAPDVLTGKSEEYFVLLSMEQLRSANVVFKILETYGYAKEKDCYHIYKPFWELISERL